MKKRYLAFGLIVMPMIAAAQDAAPAWLAIGKKDGGLVVLDSKTGARNDVLFSHSGARPEKCPAGQFYTADGNILVSCDNGAQFRLVSANGGLPPGTKVLKPVVGPRDTDDPGPSIKMK